MLRMTAFLAAAIAVGRAAAQMISFAPVELYDAGFAPGSLRVADLNGDGYPDIIVNEQQPIGTGGRVGVLLNNGDGTFAPRVTYGTGGEAKLAVGDLDGDGDLDVVAAGSFGKTFWYENDGTSVLTEHMLPDRTTAAVGIALLDYDRDGRLDIGVLSTTADFEYSHNDGGTFSSFSRRKLFDADYVESWPRALDAVDLDGDGVPEFVAASHASRTFIRLEWNGRHFNPHVLHNLGRLDYVAYGEIDGHKGLDAAYLHGAFNANSPSDGIWIACGDGTGSVSVCGRIRAALQVENPEAIAIADFDRDGRADLVVSDTAFVLQVVIATRPSGTDDWEPVLRPMIGGAARSLTTADVDLDGRMDIIAVDANVGVAVLRNTTP